MAATATVSGNTCTFSDVTANVSATAQFGALYTITTAPSQPGPQTIVEDETAGSDNNCGGQPASCTVSAGDKVQIQGVNTKRDETPE